jgi:hypothetical protein
MRDAGCGMRDAGCVHILLERYPAISNLQSPISNLQSATDALFLQYTGRAIDQKASYDDNGIHMGFVRNTHHAPLMTLHVTTA